MTEHKLLEELRRADPAPIDAARPEGVWSSDVVLHSIERRKGMMQDTTPQTEILTPRRRKPTRRLVAATVALVVAIVAGGAVIALTSGSSEPDVAATEASVTFTGSSCAYEGPAEFALDDRVTFTFVNASGVPSWTFELWAVPDGTTAEEIAERGIFEIAVEYRGDLSGTFDGIGAPTSAAPETLTRTLDIPGRTAAVCVSHPDRDTQYSSFFRIVGE